MSRETLADLAWCVTINAAVIGASVLAYLAWYAS
jgi:hypothetical protein